MTVRVLGADDVDAYRGLRLRALHDDPRAFSDAFEDERDRRRDYFAAAMGASPEHFTVGAFGDAGELVAIATFKRDARRKARHKGYVHTMYVAPEAAGLEQLHLWVLDPAASAARRLYLNAGFAPQGPVVRADLKIDGDYVDAEYLTLTL